MEKLTPEWNHAHEGQPRPWSWGSLWASSSCSSPSLAQSTLEVLVLPLEGLLVHGALLEGVPELEELGAEGPGLLLRGVQHHLRLLMPLPPIVQALVKVLLLLVQRSCHGAGLSKVRQGVPKLKLQVVPGPLQGGISGVGLPHSFSSLLQPNCQLLPEKGRPKEQVKLQSSRAHPVCPWLKTVLGCKIGWPLMSA